MHIDNPTSSADLATATAHLLTGGLAREKTLSRTFSIVVGETLDEDELLALSEQCRCFKRPTLHLSFSDGEDLIPDIVLVALDGNGKPVVHQECELWQRLDGSPAYIIPLDYLNGAFRLDSELRLEHRRRPPVARRNAVPGAARAVSALRLLAIAQGQ